MSTSRRVNPNGFTLIELLTVIAIIAILAGLLFPVLARAREKGRQAQCMSNIKSIIQAIQMYKDDHRVHPDALFGIAYNTPSGLTPFGLRLFPDYVKDQTTFVCPNSPVRPTGASVTNPPIVQAPNPVTGERVGLANWSSYDLQFRTPTITERHYALKWTDPRSAGLSDDPRQLFYKNPPDTTVVTWCLYHSSMDANGIPQPNHMALVGFLSGRVQAIPVEKLFQWPGGDGKFPWQVDPKP